MMKMMVHMKETKFFKKKKLEKLIPQWYKWLPIALKIS